MDRRKEGESTVGGGRCALRHLRAAAPVRAQRRVEFRDGPLRPAIKIIACLILFQTDLGIFIPLSYNANALWKIITKS